MHFAIQTRHTTCEEKLQYDGNSISSSEGDANTSESKLNSKVAIPHLILHSKCKIMMENYELRHRHRKRKIEIEIKRKIEREIKEILEERSKGRSLKKSK